MAEKSKEKKVHGRAEHVLGGKSAKKHKVHSMHIRKAASGGYIVKHQHETPEPPEPPQPDQEHVVPDMEALHEHMDEHMGDQPAAGEAEEAPGNVEGQ